MKKLVSMSLAAVAAVMLSTAPATAGTIGPTCGSCFGGTYSLDASLFSADATTETWRITYTLMTQAVSGAGISYVGSLAAKVSSQLISATTVVLGGNPTGGQWSAPVAGNVNNNGCGGSGEGWACIAWQSGAKLLTGATAAASYSWVFDATMAKGSLLALGSIQANFDPANGKILSENVAVPEGGAPLELPILLSGLSLWMVARTRWARRAEPRV